MGVCLTCELSVVLCARVECVLCVKCVCVCVSSVGVLMLSVWLASSCFLSNLWRLLA
jgi:hypothetical protein